MNIISKYIQIGGGKNNPLDNYTLNLLKFIKNNRSFIMGISMIFVVIYHYFCWVYNPIGGFNIGYVGVDMFLFMSGFGLTLSFEKNGLRKFYINRLVRIYPLYFLSVCLAFCIMQEKWGWSIFLENLFTIGYYIDGGINRFDWYINALILLYILFPLFYYIGKINYIGLSMLFAIVFLLMRNFPFPYWYDCLISRMPIFVYGIIFRNVYKSAQYIILFGILSYLPCRYLSSDFLASSLLSLPIIYFLYQLKFLQYNKFINFCGRYSLEIYLANEVIPRIFLIDDFDIYSKSLIYIIIQVLATTFFIITNKEIQQILKRLYRK